jgi:hypothetical protein
MSIAPHGGRTAAPVVKRAVLGAVYAALACSSARSHIYAGQLYRAERDCVERSSSIDVVDGPEPKTCAPACIIAPAPTDGGAASVYVSTMCAPYPPLFDTSGRAPVCADAVAAATRLDNCVGDAGSSNPKPKDGGGG